MGTRAPMPVAPHEFESWWATLADINSVPHDQVPKCSHARDISILTNVGKAMDPWQTLSSRFPETTPADPEHADSGHAADGDVLDRKMWHNRRFVPLRDAGIGLEDGRPLNPFGLTLHAGRLYPRWGPNHYVWTVVTQCRDGECHVLVADNRETGRVSLPESHLECDGATMLTRAVHRNLHASMCEEMRRQVTLASVLYTGYMPSARNTRHAWKEVIAVHVVVPARYAATAASSEVYWLRMTEPVMDLLDPCGAQIIRHAISAHRYEAEHVAYDVQRSYVPPPAVDSME